MNTKLTLTIEKNIIVKAKKYAKSTGDSLSGLVGNYLKAISNSSHEEMVELTPLIKSLKGSFKAEHDVDYKKELQQELSKKYINKCEKYGQNSPGF